MQKCRKNFSFYLYILCDKLVVFLRRISFFSLVKLPVIIDEKKYYITHRGGKNFIMCILKIIIISEVKCKPLVKVSFNAVIMILTTGNLSTYVFQCHCHN